MALSRLSAGPIRVAWREMTWRVAEQCSAARNEVVRREMNWRGAEPFWCGANVKFAAAITSWDSGGDRRVFVRTPLCG